MERLRMLFQNKTVRVVVLCVAALLLLLAVWKVFFSDKNSAAARESTQTELRLCALLESIEGVNGVSVLVQEEGGTAVGAVIVFDGADSILTRSRVIDVTASALSLSKSRVQVFPAKS